MNTTETLQGKWIKTAERRPEAEDASRTGHVLAFRADGRYVTTVKWSYCTPKAYPWWTRFPEGPMPPENEEEKRK